MKIVLAIMALALIASSYVLAAQTPALDRPVQVDAKPKCDCSTVPWKPDPPCVKTCR